MWVMLPGQAGAKYSLYNTQTPEAVLGPVFVWMSLELDSDIVFIIMFWVPYGLMFASISVVRMWIFLNIFG